ncbi:MAG: hypothetical protein AB1403_22450, partial [Candidatus Riflebacteria bacterium]
MADKRRLEIPLMPYLVLIAGLVMIFSSALIYATFQDMSRAAAGVAAGGTMVAAIAFFMRPEMIDELVRNRKTLLWINDIVLILLIIAIGIVLAHI